MLFLDQHAHRLQLPEVSAHSFPCFPKRSGPMTAELLGSIAEMGNADRIRLNPVQIADLERRDRDLRARVASLSWEEAEQVKHAQERDTRAAGRLLMLVLVCSGVAGFLGLQMTCAALAGFGALVLVAVPVLRRHLR